jgi:DNA-binding CsgD family transcriptional regulator
MVLRRMAQGSAGTALVAVANAWRPTSDQAGFLADVAELCARRDPTADEVLEHGTTGLARLLGDSCVASLLSDDGDWVHPLGVADPCPEVAAALEPFRGMRMRADRGFARRVLSTGLAVRLPQTSPELLRAGRPELAFFVQRFGVHSLIVAPLRSRGRAIGQLAALRARQPRPYVAEDECFVQVVADLLGLALRSAAAATGAPAPAETGFEHRGDLSPREREVLALLAIGHTNREIAEQLVLSVRTVEWHRARLQWKLGVSGRASLVACARLLHLID